MVPSGVIFPFAPLAEAVIIPTGLSEKIMVDTDHSNRFFKPLGIEKTYSGVQIIIPSAFAILARNWTISAGVFSTESSGTK